MKKNAGESSILNLLKNNRLLKIEKFKKELESKHPMQIVDRIGDIFISIFRVKYSYVTNRNNKKDGEKLFIINTCNPEYDLRLELERWVKEFNNSNKHRQISNVKFLESECIDLVRL